MDTITPIVPARHYFELAEVRRLTAVVTPASAPWLLLPLFAGARGSETDERMGCVIRPDLISPHIRDGQRVGMELGLHPVPWRTLFRSVTALEAAEFFVTPVVCGHLQRADEVRAWVASVRPR